MKEHPIIFSTEMVKAILDGRKTMTRRVIKPKPNNQWSIPPAKFCNGYLNRWGSTIDSESIICPYGQVGDRLWVRETHIYEICEMLEPNAHYDEDSEYYLLPHYKADGIDISDWVDMEAGEEGGRWRPSIFMPRWASRLTLEITEVRVERLQEMSGWDIENEGLPSNIARYDRRKEEYDTEIAFDWFKTLWDSLNAKRGYGWETNPWVWVIQFDNIGVRVK